MGWVFKRAFLVHAGDLKRKRWAPTRPLEGFEFEGKDLTGKDGYQVSHISPHLLLANFSRRA